MITRNEPCVECGQPEFHKNHFAFVNNTPVSGGHAYEAPSPAQGTPDPPKVEEIAWQFIAHVFPSMDRQQAQRFIEQGAAILRPYFPPASQTPQLKADNLFGVYCSGNPESIPKDRAIYWEGWERVANHVNSRLATPASTARTDATRCVYCTNPIAQDDQGWKITATSRYLCHANGYGYGHVPNFAAPGSVPQAPDPLKDDSRCAVCCWPLAESAEKGCVRGNCSQRPFPEVFYDLERANREYGKTFGVPAGVPQAEPPKEGE